MAVNITNRADAEALIREQIVSTIFQDAPKQSVFMGMAPLTGWTVILV